MCVGGGGGLVGDKIDITRKSRGRKKRNNR